jgi:4-amino-4-deoxy-L-arabinose transferase-like glycosyltransferase
MKKNLGVFLFVGIFIIGFLLRFYQLGEIPNSLNWDEVSWGYNGYSILETARDEHGAFMPLSFKAFGDFKQPVYVYLDAASIFLFGLNSFAVRFPSALLGTISIIFVFLFVRELFKKDHFGLTVSYITMLLYAISPWSIQFSRVAFEANVGLVLVLIGAFLFLRGINTKDSKFLFASCIPFALSAYTYHSEKIIAPLLFAGFVFYAYKFFLPRKRLLVFLGLFFIFCNIFWLIDMRTTARGRSVMFTSNQTQILEDSTKKIQYEAGLGNPYGAILHNRRLVYLNTYVKQYLAHFNLNFLFVIGDNARHHAPGVGVLYLVAFPFILIGIYLSITKRLWSMVLVFYWLLLAPAASALAVDAPNASRSMIVLPTWDIFAGLGIYFASLYLLKIRYGRLGIACIGLFFFINFFYYAHQYFVHTNFSYGPYWQYGYREAVEYTKRFANSEKNVFFLKDIEQAYIFHLFYNSYSPSDYQKDGGSQRLSQKCFSIQNSYFGECNEKISRGDILVTSIDPNMRTYKIHTIYHVNGQEAIHIYQKR